MSAISLSRGYMTGSPRPISKPDTKMPSVKNCLINLDKSGLSEGFPPTAHIPEAVRSASISVLEGSIARTLHRRLLRA